jgi:N,N-dimethylformamidase
MATTEHHVVSAELIKLLDGTPDTKTSAPAPTARLDPPVVAEGPGKEQHSVVGSRAELPLPANWHAGDDVLIRCWVFPTTAGIPPGEPDDKHIESPRMAGRLTAVEARRQVMWAIGRASGDMAITLVFLADSRIAVEVGGKTVATTSRPARTQTWYGILVTLSGTSLTLDVTAAVGPWYVTDHVERVTGEVSGDLLADTDLFRLASSSRNRPGDVLNGKIASPSISLGAAGKADAARLLAEPMPLPGRIVGAWNPSLETGGDTVIDTGPNKLHGKTFSLPGRAMTGPFWSTRHNGVDQITPQHDAIHFHADDVGDLGWEPTLQIAIPDDLASGIYAIRIAAGPQFMHIPLFVRPKKAIARVAFLASTNTYLAYANHRMFLGNDELNHLIASHPVVPNERDVLVLEYPFLGRSVYDVHDDGSGVNMATWNRPLISFEPAARDFLAAGPRNFQADLYVIGWLERSGLGCDVITDEDLHAEGLAALRPYDVVITGSHPEYWSRPMIDGLEGYLMTRGKLMYLGGNGFYWATGITADKTAIEVRRGFTGTRPWDSGQGETVLSTSGEPAGHWRDLHPSPQQLVGVGFTSQGWGGGRGYKRLPQSFDPHVAPFFEGIGDDETIGDFGHIMGGAAGDEVDRLDFSLGTPPHALHLATSLPFPDQYQLAVEEVRNMAPAFGGSQTEMVRADIVWFDLPGGGEVFSVGSVNWPASMGWNGGDNNVARLTMNALKAFLAGGPQERSK